MPTYQYACTECGEPLEVVQKFTDDALTECPECGGRLRKIFSAAAIVFRGSGFYRTDSRSGSASGSKNGASAEGSAKDGASKDGSSTDGASKETAAKKDTAKTESSSTKSASGSSPEKVA